MDFVAFDFETANERRTSACSLAVVVVENNTVVERRHWYIKPYPCRFNSFNTALHGIAEDHVADALTFAELWPEIKCYFEKRTVVAHNASFDTSVLIHLLDHYQIDIPESLVVCTYRLSQCVHPYLSCYKLNILSELYGIPLVHHHATSDAEACAALLLRFSETASADTLCELEKRLHFQIGRLGESPCHPNRLCPRKTTRAVSESEAIRQLNAAPAEYMDDDLRGKSFVFTGTLLSMPRAKAFEIVSRGGGFLENGVTKKTNYLVVGTQDMLKVIDGKSSKMKKAELLRSQRQDIQIIDEDDFLKLIDDELFDLVFSDRSGCHDGREVSHDLRINL